MHHQAARGAAVNIAIRYIGNVMRALDALLDAWFHMERAATFGEWVWGVLVKLDCLANAIFLGDPDETISSRAGRYARRSWPAHWLCQLLSLIDHRHCEKSIQDGEGGDAICDNSLVFLAIIVAGGWLIYRGALWVLS